MLTHLCTAASQPQLTPEPSPPRVQAAILEHCSSVGMAASHCNPAPAKQLHHLRSSNINACAFSQPTKIMHQETCKGRISFSSLWESKTPAIRYRRCNPLGKLLALITGKAAHGTRDHQNLQIHQVTGTNCIFPQVCMFPQVCSTLEARPPL